MFGRIALVGTLLTFAFLALVGWTTGLLQVTPAAAQERPKADSAQSPPPAPATSPGLLKAQAVQQPAPPQSFQDPAERLLGSAEPIVMTSCKVELSEKQDVPAEREGKLEFVGIELKPGETLPPGDQGYRYNGKTYRRLKEGDRVEANQLIGLVDPKLAEADLDIKIAKLTSAEADSTASEKTRDEAYKRYQTQETLWNGGVRSATTLEDLRGAKLSYDRYVYEVYSKKAAIKVAEQEKKQAEKIMRMHEIRPKISGIVKTIYKYPGEPVAGANAGRNAEPVALIHDYDRLRVEGTLDLQYAKELHQGMEVVIEPNYRDSPAGTYNAHLRAITGLAVSKDRQNPAIVSGSLDGTVKVWSLDPHAPPLRIFVHPTEVTAIACTPADAQANLCLSGGHDGKARIWDLDSKPEKGKQEDTPLLELKAAHRGAIRSVAFSLDGKVCATGGDDAVIQVFDTATGEMLYPVPNNREAAGHHNTITTLQFTTGGQLVSVSKDETVRVWTVSTTAAEELQQIKRRSVNIDMLGVSRDGKLLLDEDGKEIGVMTLPDKFTWTTLRSHASADGFSKLALFSPDDRLVLTSTGHQGLQPGNLQLWSLSKVRSHQVRQFIPGMYSETTAAAFAPSGSFVVAGNRDGKINIWAVPSADEIKQQITGRISEVEQTVEGTENRVRVVAEFANSAKLHVGELVNMVVYPTKRVGSTVSLLQGGQR
jgi:WD40 repeat protein